VRRLIREFVARIRGWFRIKPQKTSEPEKFITDLTNISRTSGIEFVSFFWVREFYSYLDYDQYHTVPLDQISPVINKVSIANSMKNILSPLGVFFPNWITRQTR